MGAAVIYCGCSASPNGDQRGAKFQDVKYGNGLRLFNRGKKIDDNHWTFRCTICDRTVRSEGK